MLYNNQQVGGFMFYLVIAQGKYCEQYKIIKTGSYDELSLYTSKFNDSNEIRNNNKSIVNDFIQTYNNKGDIVIMDDNNNRYRVIYKKHVMVAKELVKSQKFMQSMINSYALLVSEWDYKSIMYLKEKSYLKHIKDFIKRRKRPFTTIRIITKYYEDYQRRYKDLPSINILYKSLLDKKKNKVSDTYLDKCSDNYDIKNDEFYNKVSDSLNNGGYEEVFNDYSLDELGANMYQDDFKKLVKSGY